MRGIGPVRRGRVYGGTGTDFPPPAYALLEVLIVMIISRLFIARFRGAVAECLTVPFVSLNYLYMLRLIKYVDQGFNFEVGRRGLDSGEVALFRNDA